MKPFLIKRWRGLSICIFLFTIALGLRLHYQHNSIVLGNIRADSLQYYTTAYNLYTHGIYSAQLSPRRSVPPQADAARSPGYPLFLLPFFYFHNNLNQIMHSVMTTQAILGSLSVVLTFLLARSCLGYLASFLAGLLTATSPHLIAAEKYLLTETLFTCVLLTSCLALVYARRQNNGRIPILSILAGGLFGLTALIKPAALLLGPLLAALFFLNPKKTEATGHNRSHRQILWFLAGYILIYSPFLIRNTLTLDQIFPESGRGWSNIVEGSYPNLMFKTKQFSGHPHHEDPKFNKMKDDKQYFFKIMRQRFSVTPWPYIKWYLGGKIIYSWKWDLITGDHDVYIYPMFSSGFRSSKILQPIHAAMKNMHSPLALLALFGCIMFAIKWRRDGEMNATPALMLSIMIIIYHALQTTVMLPEPRYTIPLRPICYLLASAFLASSFYKIKELVPVRRKP